ncbi:uncharacterized protein [Littorina saxatilis]|uniref:uncharacterized protein n=1 Tax=Littorina saxatilis TaxID=31220 RepID=UPI0038B5D124
MNSCEDSESSLLNINVRQKKKHPPHWRICNLDFVRGICFPSPGCTCDNLSQNISVESYVEGSRSQQWELVGTLQNNLTFRTEVLIQVKQQKVQSTEASPDPSISTSLEDFTLTSTTEQVPSPSDDKDSSKPSNNDKTADMTPTFGFILLGAILGCVFLMVLVMAIFLVILFKRKGRTQSVPPPPAPHTFRHPPMMDAVMFHAQAAGQDHRESFVSVQGHIYHEISDDSEHSSPAISTVYNESSFSSEDNGNGSDGYLHPTGSASDIATATKQVTPVSTSTDTKETCQEGRSGHTERETSGAIEVTDNSPAAIAEKEPPYENIVNMS